MGRLHRAFSTYRLGSIQLPVFIIQRFVLVVVVCLSTTCSATTSSSPTTTTTPPPPGLRNLGNTCYLNAQLQCAYHIPKVQSLVLNPPHQETMDIKESSESEDVECQVTTTTATATTTPSAGLLALRRLFQDMNHAIESNSGTIAAPRLLVQTLGIPVMMQQDSQEFWKLLLPTLQLPQLTDLYQGAFEDYIVALDGTDRERRREEAFLDLSLDVSTGSVVKSLKTLFGEPELLSAKEGNGWRPQKGADRVDAHKGSLLRAEGLPSILQLHLKRFHFDWNTETTTKINDPFTFPKTLDLADVVASDGGEIDGDRLTYELQAIVVHMGEFDSGHYYAYVRPNVRKDEWYRVNDATVTSVTYSDVVQDSFGGKTSGTSEKGCFIARIFNAFRSSSYGYGGRTSNAYVLQYVKKSDLPLLYG